MLYIRLGPRYLFLQTHNIKQIEHFYTQVLDGRLLPFAESFNRANEHCTIIFLMESEKATIEKASSVIFFPHGSSIALCHLVNHNLIQFIEKVQLGPGTIVMRVPRTGETLLEKIKTTYSSKEMDFYQAVQEGKNEDTILCITNQSLHHTIGVNSTLSTPLLIREQLTVLFDDLRKDGLLYITNELEENQWCELKINIYDSEENYEMHYKRLIHVITHLDLGMILGESWTRDHALSLFSVLAYQVRLFTLYSPIYIKGILKGLEYDDKGNRLVDFDLYYKNKKVSAAQLKTDTHARLKSEKGVYFRKKLIQQLSPESLEYINHLEKQSH